MAVEYEAVIGLEVHAQLKTRSKIFCGCSTAFGAAPNTQTCPVCLGLPGALPVLNKKAVELAIRAALAANCEIRLSSRFARKNYFYPDLPKGYQISQFELPISEHGYLEIPSYAYTEKGGQLVKTGREGWRKIRITRIHMEEDAGKNLHQEGGGTAVDLNRAGVPLVEIVGAPDLRSGEEAAEYLKALHHLVTTLDVCDGNMEEGSFRCDANVSIRPKGEEKLGVRAEIKNLNSFRFVRQAIDYEIARQKAALAAGETLKPETRGFHSDKGQTYKMREKEGSDDYRYFPEPDLPPLVLDPNWVTAIGQGLPELFKARVERLERDFKIEPDAAETLAWERGAADYFEAAAKGASHPQKIANWILNTELLEALKAGPRGGDGAPSGLPVTPEALRELVAVIEDERLISGKIAKEVFAEMAKTGQSPREIISARSLAVVSDEAAIEAEARKLVEASPKEAAEYRAGKEKLLGHFVGQLMKAMKGKADPKTANQVLKKILKEGS